MPPRRPAPAFAALLPGPAATCSPSPSLPVLVLDQPSIPDARVCRFMRSNSSRTNNGRRLGAGLPDSPVFHGLRALVTGTFGKRSIARSCLHVFHFHGSGCVARGALIPCLSSGDDVPPFEVVYHFAQICAQPSSQRQARGVASACPWNRGMTSFAKSSIDRRQSIG